MGCFGLLGCKAGATGTKIEPDFVGQPKQDHQRRRDAHPQAQHVEEAKMPPPKNNVSNANIRSLLSDFYKVSVSPHISKCFLRRSDWGVGAFFPFVEKPDR
jgi:hypothetical protein